MLHAIGLATVALSYARGRAIGGRRLQARLEQSETEIALIREELAIKDGRWDRARSRRRPHYTPFQRMRILQLRTARGWTLEKTARVFLVDLQTLMIWMRRLDEPGERTLIRTVEPVNRYPDLVRHLVQDLKSLLPAMGSRARAGTCVTTDLSRWRPTANRGLDRCDAVIRRRSTRPEPAIFVSKGPSFTSLNSVAHYTPQT